MRNSSEICQEYSRSSYKGTWLNQYIMEKITKILKEEEENKSTIPYRWLQCRLMLLGRVLKVYADPCLIPSHPRDSNKRLKDNSIIACAPHKLPAPARTFLLRVSQKKIRKACGGGSAGPSTSWNVLYCGYTCIFGKRLQESIGKRLFLKEQLSRQPWSLNKSWRGKCVDILIFLSWGGG